MFEHAEHFCIFVLTLFYFLSCADHGILWLHVFVRNDINITDSTFRGFNREGLLWFQQSSNITLDGNTFEVNTDNLFYDVSDPYFESGYAAVYYLQCFDTTTIRNTFSSNPISTATPWIKYLQSSKTVLGNCLTANHFTNYAFYAEDTNITSCARPELLDCAVFDNPGNNDTVDCELEMYGEMDPVLFDEMGTFTVDEYHDMEWAVFWGSGSMIALDNVLFQVWWSCVGAEWCFMLLQDAMICEAWH